VFFSRRITGQPTSATTKIQSIRSFAKFTAQLVGVRCSAEHLAEIQEVSEIVIIAPDQMSNFGSDPLIVSFSSLFQRSTSNGELIIETGRPQSSSQASTLEIARNATNQSTTVPCRASSNSLLNTNLSGSFKDEDEGFTTDDDLILRKQRTPNRARSQPLPSSSSVSEAGTSSQPSVVAALPNPNFNPDVPAGGRRKRPRNGNFIV
jgi:hypothetical protein